MTVCNLSYKEVGPYAQTLFLGCSLINISQNLAWGAEPSTCQVRLIRDFSSHPSDPAFGQVTTNIDTIVNSNTASTLFDSPNLDNTDTAKTVQKNIALEEKNKETYRTTEDIQNTTLNSLKDNGKKCWNAHDYNTDPVNWIGPDPGFIGDGGGLGFMGGNQYLIVGVPCFFKFQDVQFGGYVKKWTCENGIYTVDIEGPGSYLKGAQLILNDYYGSISTIISSAVAVHGQALAVPYGDLSVNQYNGTIFQGNIPNVFNIFGYLQSQGFNTALVSENGINAAQVYDTLVTLLGQDSIVKNQFSPYGAIVGRSLIEFTGEGDIDFIVPQNAVKNYGGVSINYTQLGILNHKLSVDGKYRPLFRLDISQVPRPNNNIYMPLTKSMTIEDFINFCCTGAGLDWNTTLDPDFSSSDYTGTIFINTYDRKIQPAPNALKSWIRSFSASDRVVSYNIGEEYSDSNVRKMIVGAKQERLFQVMSNTLSKYRNWRIYDPIDSKFINPEDDMDTQFLSDGNFRNIMRVPNVFAQRAWDSSYGGPYRTYGGAATAQVPNDFKTAVNIEASNINVMKGSYTTSKPILRSALQGATIAGGSYPIYYDLISPYFGRDSDGNLRKVFYDRKLKQLQVNVMLKDIAPFFPLYYGNIYTGYMTVYEDEIRAAIAGLDSWMSYLFEPIKSGFGGTPTTKVILRFIREFCGDQFSDAFVYYGMGVLKTDTKQSALPSQGHSGDPVSPGSRIMFSSAVYPVIQKLHQFISSNLGQHYGKSFLIRLPNIKRRVDSLTGKANYSYQICDSGWEEQGNFLDDTMQIGSVAATALAKENGKFGAILGFHASAEEDRTVPAGAFGGTDMYGILAISPAGQMALRMDMQNSRRDGNSFYFPLVHDLPMNEVVLMEHKTYSLPDSSNRGANTFTTLPVTRDSFGSIVPDGKKYKLYVKANVASVVPENTTNQQIIFSNDAQYCVVEAPSKIYQRSNYSLVSTLYNTLYAATVNGIEVAANNNTSFPPFSRGAMTATSLLFLVAMTDSWVTKGGSITFGTNSEGNLPIAPKCPVPCFAAIPYRDNLSVYGPWTSHPGLIKDLIFPDFSSGAESLVNNIVGGVDIDINEGYNPWDYGGMDNLDTAVLTQLSDNNKYQQVIEAGTMTVAGIMLTNTNIGSTIFGAGSPMVNSIQIEMGEDGYRTTYHFRTYSRKLGFYNQETAKNIQMFGKQAMETKKLIVDNNRLSLAKQSSLQDPSADRAARIPKSLSYSPVSVLVGGAMPIIHKNSTLTNAVNQLGWDPLWHLNPKIPENISVTPKDMVRHQGSVSLYDPEELSNTIWRPEEWNSKSIMSLDGFFSPISFYPTPYGATYPITRFPRTNCPYCKGAGTYTYKSFDNSSTYFTSTTTDPSATDMNANVTSKTATCNFCVPDVVVSGNKKNSARPSEVSPPFILASGDDRTIISNRATAFQYSSSIINTYTLNPLVMSATGSDFSCYQNKQSTDKCGHVVDIVSFGNIMPEPQDCLRAYLSKTIEKNYAAYDVNLANADSTIPSGFQNIRSFGLRGPLMLHSWGYDLEGYPVPNSSGEPKTDSTGAAVLDSDGNPVYKNQIQQSDGSYSKPYKEHTFYKGWAQIPTTWPVGPIDLRWDDNARIWTVGANYKPVWVVIETDLLNKEPVRGIIFDALYDDTPLPSGLRKLVFVRDTVGMFSSPRGSALYCRYDSRNGFYEPIYNRPLVTTGIINAGNTATIYQAYTPSGALRSDGTISTYDTSFDNPLDFNASSNSIGLFSFLNGKWILQAVKE